MLATILFLLIGGRHAGAADVSAAVAANFATPMEKLALDFTKKTGHKVLISAAATGKLFAQVQNGAPFDVFLSADRETSQKLVMEKLAVEGTVFPYAIGKLVLWSRDGNLVDKNGDVLGSGKFAYLSLANPKLAPYGVAAKEALEKKGLWEKLAPKLVLGENIAQAFQFVESGNAELGFVALSQVQSEGAKPLGSRWIVPASLYSPLRQDAVLLNRAKENAAAKALLAFLKSPEARKRIQESGYEIPEGAAP